MTSKEPDTGAAAAAASQATTGTNGPSTAEQRSAIIAGLDADHGVLLRCVYGDAPSGYCILISNDGDNWGILTEGKDAKGALNYLEGYRDALI